MRTKLAAFSAVVFATTAILTGVAYAAPPTPAAEATTVFNDSWPDVLDLVKTMAPIVIGAGLTLLAIRKVVGAVSRGKAPKIG